MNKILFYVIALLLIGCGACCPRPSYIIGTDEVSLVRKLKWLKKKYPEYYNVVLTGEGGIKFSPDEYVESMFYCVGLKMPMGDTTVVVKVLVNVHDLNVKNIDVTSPDAKSTNKECELFFQAYSFTNGNSWRLNGQHVGAKEEQEKVLKTFEKEVLDKIRVRYRRQRFR